MPGCKFQDAWLKKDIYKDWLLRDFQDIHLARCRACCKLIKLQTMGEAALSSHAAGAHHKAAVRRLILAQENGDCSIMNEDNKARVAFCLQRDPLDTTTAGAWSELHHSSSANSMSHNAEFQEVEFPTTYITLPGTAKVINKRLHPSILGRGTEEALRPDAAVDLSRLEQQHQRVEALEHRISAGAESMEQQERADALSQQQQMKLLEWESRMKVLEWEQEVLREKRRAARQKEKAFRMKKTYYQAKLKQMGQDVAPSSSSSGDEEEKLSHQTR